MLPHAGCNMKYTNIRSITIVESVGWWLVWLTHTCHLFYLSFYAIHHKVNTIQGKWHAFAFVRSAAGAIVQNPHPYKKDGTDCWCNYNMHSNTKMLYACFVLINKDMYDCKHDEICCIWLPDLTVCTCGEQCIYGKNTTWNNKQQLWTNHWYLCTCVGQSDVNWQLAVTVRREAVAKETGISSVHATWLEN